MPKYTYHDKPDSSMLSDIYYNSKTKELFVLFHNGTFAGYRDVTPEVADAFVEAPSVGVFYNQNIKGKFGGLNTEGLTREDFVKDVPVAVSVGSVQRSFHQTGFGSAPTSPDVKPNFVIGGLVMAPRSVTANIQADTMAEAIAKFEEMHGDKFIEVTTVSKTSAKTYR